MVKKLLNYYTTPLLVSATLGVIILAMTVAKQPIEIIEIIIGIILGTFVLDIEFILYPYMFEPNSDFAKNIFGYTKSKDFKGLISFINEHRDGLKEKSLNSALFQVVLIPICLLVAYTDTSYFMKAFVLSIFANSIYKLIECYFNGTTKEWFWAIKGTPKKEGVLGFILVLILILVVSIYLI
ncbi:MAG TPA: hypothetical protein PLM44_00345 [bacterium]|jgi:hypothetical protein|nr:hypothetical protein [Patescibacteria group bacterium]HOS88500.1 hypothetical protein [bacterium]HQG58275.1 hypothetical protein [bacterium]HQG78802.1 hypothetical protein [bacterium]HQK41465.1 hypothetical protein [bacterium]